MSDGWHDVDGQRRRQQQVYDLLIEYTADSFDMSGQWIGSWMRGSGQPGLRERLWFCIAFLGSGRPELADKANAIITSCRWGHCTFSPMASGQLLLKYPDRLDAEATHALRDYLQGELASIAGPNMDFVGVNDNFPAMSTFDALFCGRLFERDDLYAIGLERLDQLRRLLTRRGVLTEYGSPTYTPISAYCMAEIANLTDDPDVRELALECETRHWVDILGHYHPTTFYVAGPYSRAYTVDSLAHPHQANFVLYALLGERLTVNPVNTLLASRDGVPGQMVHGCPAFMQVSNAWLASTTFHCPTWLVDRLADKPTPFRFRATTEFSSSTDAPPDAARPDPNTQDELYEYAAGSGTVSTFMTPDYALGVATHEFHSGVQTDSFHLLYRRRPVQRLADIATVYARYVVNDRKPGQSNDYPTVPPVGTWPDEPVGTHTSGDNLLRDEGRKLGLHHDRTAMVLYKPKAYARRGVTSLKLCLLFPARYGPPQEMWLGDRRVDRFPCESVEPCAVFVKDGPVLMCFHPLILTDHGRRVAVKAEQVNDHVVVSLYNYEGPRRDFARRGFLLTGNGFVCEVRSETECTLNAFRQEMAGAEVNDSLFACDHTRQTFLRRTRYARPGLTLECEYSPASEGIKHIAVNGRVPAQPVLEVTGLDASRLPFLDDVTLA